ncbi:MAG: MBOAT family protein [Lachnospiraceae bacterium]|nr:MBOAT family protein [Lachnospiraceae bacterium]
MLFNSYIFLFLFFPLCFAGYEILKGRNVTLAKLWLIGFSFWFYGYFRISYLGIMVASILLNYGVFLCLKGSASASFGEDASGRFAEASEKKRKRIFAAGVGANLLLLFYYKYIDFLIENINLAFGADLPLLHILLPLGISFFTFQQISFLTDAYRRRLWDCSFVDYLLFVSFFPQLIAGPIVTQEEMLPQFQSIGRRKWQEEHFCRGIFIFVLGLAKKVLVADTFGGAVDAGYGMVEQLGGTDAFLVMIFYALQLYFDFSGYCDMAMGLGGMLGFEIPMNFNSPYKAANIIEFWKRWHITLSRFFTSHVYIPLGGNRGGRGKMYRNLLLVFLVSGVWHGAGWNYIVWGMLHGILYCATRWCQEKKWELRLPRGIKMAATFLFASGAFVFFRSESIPQALLLFERMGTGGFALPSDALAEAFRLDELWYVMKVLGLTEITYSRYLLMAVLAPIMLGVVFFGRNVHEMAEKTKLSVVSAAVTGVLFVWCVLSLSGVGRFLYFNF